MGLSGYNIKKWLRMLLGRSVLHVNQSVGNEYLKNEIRGYYNNLTEKVSMQPELLHSEALPLLTTETGDHVYFPVAIFQYGLGAFDLYLKTKEEIYLTKFRQCVDWALENQQSSGAWSNFFYIYPDYPYGAMAQGEGASLLLRGYKFYGDGTYYRAAKRAIDFMLLPLSEGGTTLYENEKVVLLEYTHMGAVLNGWIFAWWGLYDFVLSDNDKAERRYRELLDKSCHSLIGELNSFSCPYWSMYDLNGRIASPFYHNLHIAQMQAMYDLTGHPAFYEFGRRWERQQKDIVCKTTAFIRKSVQKLLD